MIIKELIKRKGITQGELIKNIGISRKTLTNYLNGTTEPTQSVLIKMAEFFDVSLDYLCGRQYNNNVGYIPDERKDTVKKIISLEDMKFQKVDGYVDSLINN